MIPRIDHIDAASFEIGHIPSRDRRIMDTGGGGDLAIGKVDRTTCGAAFKEDFGEGDRNDAIDWQHATSEVASQDRLDRFSSAKRRLPAGRSPTPRRSSASLTAEM